MRPARCINVHQNAGPGATIPDPGSPYPHPRPQPRKTPLMTCSKVCFGGRKRPAPPNILKKPFPPEGDGRGRNYVYTRSHRITQFYTAVHNYCRNSLFFPQPNTAFLLPLLYEGNPISLIAGCTFVYQKYPGRRRVVAHKKRVASFFNSHPPCFWGGQGSFCPAKTHPAIEDLLHQLHTNRALNGLLAAIALTRY
jgi:hypothetical protein